ncbi:hypothetical protein UCRPA7_5252 [Phaeoacremonium minimum UCRPA7]|uniref:Uncharacterized protein n=1 Tax=Phaeoacremonium minimum (strain UCR-PA7) TaxID=1286976 RepID=R8BIS3_PHAM7|nr:hypothetical protein UCRPA7_5252 [Phaeoacremonium minimum UCRPA7]EON99220.1 hypothetical protein UCRPA7_5252 [Phaeoacremonium minimum UCRPA7]
MKAVLVTLLALAASALAGPIIAERQLDTQASAIDSLTEQIKGYTASINKTTEAAPSNPSLADQNAAAAALAPDFQGITDALNSATTLLSKRDFWVEERGLCDKTCLLIKVKILVYEIICTLKFVIIKLGLGCVLLYLKPLIIALSGLIKCLDKVVDGLLFAVKGILDALLGTIAGALLGLL